MLDKEIVTILTQISVAKREAEIKLDETDFYEKKMINKRKKLILEELERSESSDEVDIDKEEKKQRKRRKKLKSLVK